MRIIGCYHRIATVSIMAQPPIPMIQALRMAVMAMLVGVLAAPMSLAQDRPTDAASTAFPRWAALWDPAFRPRPATDDLIRLPGSDEAFSTRQARNLFFSPDWHPGDHPTMPGVVAHGREPNVRACGSCHRAEGTGGPENAPVAGLPEAYIVQQMEEFRSGARMFATPQRSEVHDMTRIGLHITDDEIREAAAYFASLPMARILTVVEADTIPKTYVAGLIYARDPAGGTEPLAGRIVEMPNDIQQFELRDSRSRFTVYVPVGSIAKGKALVYSSGANGKAPCTVCHGEDLKGLGPVPGIAGRSPSYMMRQLYDFQQGARAGAWSALMTAQVAPLTIDDMTHIVAYLATLEP